MTAIERALADLVGGMDGGLTLWEIACAKLEKAGRESQDDCRFRAYPGGAMNRLLVAVEDALRVAGLAVELQASLDDEPAVRSAEQRADDVAALLLDRARSLVAVRHGGPTK